MREKLIRTIRLPLRKFYGKNHTIIIALFRFLTWFLTWLLKLVDLVIKLIELIPGE